MADDTQVVVEDTGEDVIELPVPLNLKEWGTLEQAKVLRAEILEGYVLKDHRYRYNTSGSGQGNYVTKYAVVETMLPEEGDDYAIAEAKQNHRLAVIRKNLEFEVMGMLYSNVTRWDVVEDEGATSPEEQLNGQVRATMRAVLPRTVELTTKMMVSGNNFIPDDWKTIYTEVMNKLNFHVKDIVEKASNWND